MKISCPPLRRPLPSLASLFANRASKRWVLVLAAIGMSSLSIAFGPCATPIYGDDSFVPNQKELPVAAPKDAIVLIGSEKEHMFLSMAGTECNWPIENGVMTSTHAPGNVNHIVSKWHFRDADIHVEFNVSPKSQGNSGIYIHGHYELQILDSHGKKNEEISEQDEGSLYGFSKPLTNAAKPAGEWQVYDIRYRAPRRDAEGKITEQGAVTVWLNGSKVQDNTRFGEPKSVYHPFRHGTTDYLKKIAPKLRSEQVGPVFLQDHGSPTQFRNVWIKPLDDKAHVWAE